jgi:hypothetical protein
MLMVDMGKVLQDRRAHRGRSICAVAALGVSLSAGCAGSDAQIPGLTGAQRKIPAIKSAAETRDISAAPEMVKDLESDDPAVRFYAIEGLERLTGETFGYVYYDDELRRREAVMRWKRWLDQRR